MGVLPNWTMLSWLDVERIYMTKVSVDVNDQALEIAVREEIKRMTKRIKQLETTNSKLKSQINEQKEQTGQAKQIIDLAVTIGEVAGMRPEYWGQS